MMKAAPASSLVVAKSKFLLEVLVVPLDPPTQLDGRHQRTAADRRGQRGEKILGRFGFVGGPFDHAPFLGAWRGALVIAMCGTNTHGGETRSEFGVGAFAPGHPPPGSLWKAERQLLGRNRLMLAVTTDRRGRTT